MSVYTLISSPTLPQKLAITCAAVMGLAVVSLFSAAPIPSSLPSPDAAVTLPVVVVVPSAADRAAAAALDVVAAQAARPRDGV